MTDTILGASGNKNVVGGYGKDTITVTTGNHIILGDNGLVTFNAAGLVVEYRTTDTLAATGDDDVISTGDGNNTILGGMGADRITTGIGTDMILGDNGAGAAEG